MTRADGRAPDELRPTNLTAGWQPTAEGSCLVEMGNTKVLCTATVEQSVPRWLQGQKRGWVTAEYSMLPRSTTERVAREVNKGRPSGRTQEIQRLIGRSLRAVVDMEAIGEHTIVIDCDVLRADGGTRTASITGAYVALAHGCRWLEQSLPSAKDALHDLVAAVSVGLVDGTPCLDLDYVEDSSAEVDMNLVMTGSARFVEVQGTAERGAFERHELDAMIELGRRGIDELVELQRSTLAAAVE